MSDERSVSAALFKGLARKCPDCGTGKIFSGYIKVNHTCSVCGLELHHQRADDAPPYFTMIIVLHLVMSGMIITEKAYSPETWVQLSIWMPTALIASLLLLPPIKGALIGLQWARQMHGFGNNEAEYDPLGTE